MTSLPSVEDPLGRTANLFHKDGTESAPLHRGRSNASVPTASSDSAEARGGRIASYIYISTSHWRFDAHLRKHPRKVFKAAKVLWSHDVRICIAVGVLPLSLAVLDQLSYISRRTGNGALTSALFNVEKRVLGLCE
jgi:hypothetical protein